MCLHFEYAVIYYLFIQVKYTIADIVWKHPIPFRLLTYTVKRLKYCIATLNATIPQYIFHNFELSYNLVYLLNKKCMHTSKLTLCLSIIFCFFTGSNVLNYSLESCGLASRAQPINSSPHNSHSVMVSGLALWSVPYVVIFLLTSLLSLCSQWSVTTSLIISTCVTPLISRSARSSATWPAEQLSSRVFVSDIMFVLPVFWPDLDHCLWSILVLDLDWMYGIGYWTVLRLLLDRAVMWIHKTMVMTA